MVVAGDERSTHRFHLTGPCPARHDPPGSPRRGDRARRRPLPLLGCTCVLRAHLRSPSRRGRPVGHKPCGRSDADRSRCRELARFSPAGTRRRPGARAGRRSWDQAWSGGCGCRRVASDRLRVCVGTSSRPSGGRPRRHGCAAPSAALLLVCLAPVLVLASLVASYAGATALGDTPVEIVVGLAAALVYGFAATFVTVGFIYTVFPHTPLDWRSTIHGALMQPPAFRCCPSRTLPTCGSAPTSSAGTRPMPWRRSCCSACGYSPPTFAAHRLPSGPPARPSRPSLRGLVHNPRDSGGSQTSPAVEPNGMVDRPLERIGQWASWRASVPDREVEAGLDVRRPPYPACPASRAAPERT